MYSYVKWAEQSGLRVVPLLIDDSHSNLVDMVQNLNGVLFTGK